MKNRTLIIFIPIILAATAGVYIAQKKAPVTPKNIPSNTPVTVQDSAPTPLPTTPEPLPTPEPEQPAPTQSEYRTMTLTTIFALKELTAAVGEENVATVLNLNRIDEKHLKQNMTLIVPSDFATFDAYSPFPSNLAVATEMPKLMLISQRVQAFGIYEYGSLVRWGAVSTGKKSTPTPSDLFFTNWKGRRVISSFSDEWILEWNFNLDNFEGIGMHKYEMPGYPASHSCVRMLEADARWIYDWADQWIITPDGNTKLANGTPVIIFGSYAFEQTAPWKKLPEDPEATDLDAHELSELINTYRDTILQNQAERTRVLSEQQ